MITCSRCGKENQDHYKFCLGCGAKLERPAAPTAAAGTVATSPTAPPTAPPGNGGLGARLSAGGAARPSSAAAGYTPPPVALTPAPRPSAAAAPVAAAAAPIPVTRAPAPAPAPIAVAPVAAAPAGGECPQCGNKVTPANTFCGRCGYRLKSTPSNPGPAPAAAGPTPGSAPMPRTMFMAGAQPAARPGPRGHLTLIRPDGSEGGMHSISEGENLIGRGQGSLFDADPYLSPRHAEFVLDGEGLMVRDLKSLNGVFIKVTEEEALDSGSIFRIGQELLRFDVIEPPTPLEDGTEIIGTPNPGYWGRISVIVGRDVDGPAFPIFEESIVLGRERGDILFPEDGYVSATHARITLRDGHVYLQDLGSSNGTFIRIGGSRVVPPGSLLLMGQQLFRVQYQ